MGIAPTPTDFSPLVLAGLALLVLSPVSLVAALVAALRRRPWRFLWRTFAGMALLVLGVSFVAIGWGLAGYRALTREELAATVEVFPKGPQSFEAAFEVPGQGRTIIPIKGDSFYVDAHILKWTPLANLLGLHTSYELDRVAGRYDSVEQEKGAERTVFSLAIYKRTDLVDLRRRFPMLFAAFYDAEYGSGTFVRVTRPATYEVMVSTTGLLMREVPGESPKP